MNGVLDIFAYGPNPITLDWNLFQVLSHCSKIFGTQDTKICHSTLTLLWLHWWCKCLWTAWIRKLKVPQPRHINCSTRLIVPQLLSLCKVHFGHENECWSRLTTESCCTYWSNGGGNSSIAVITGTKWWEAKVLKTRSVPVLVCACVMPSSLVWISFTSSTTWENRTDVLGVDSFKKFCLPSQCVNLHHFLTLAPEFWRYCWAQHMHR